MSFLLCTNLFFIIYKYCQIKFFRRTWNLGRSKWTQWCWNNHKLWRSQFGQRCTGMFKKLPQQIWNPTQNFLGLEDSKPGKTLILRWTRPVSNPERLDLGWVIFRFFQTCTRPKALVVSYLLMWYFDLLSFDNFFGEEKFSRLPSKNKVADENLHF